LFDPGGPQTHQGELSRHEETIRQNEADNGNNVEECPVDHGDRVKQRPGKVGNFLWRRQLWSTSQGASFRSHRTA
jgi:hypothetical protein